MGFTSEAVQKYPSLIPPDGNRAWEVWDEPPPTLPDTLVAFRLVFHTPELAVSPEHRNTRQWEDTLFIESAPPASGTMTLITLFVTIGDPELAHATEPSLRLASLDLSDGRRAQLVAHGEPEGGVPEMISAGRKAALAQAAAAGIDVPEDGYIYLFGNQPDGARFIVGARTTAE